MFISSANVRRLVRELASITSTPWFASVLLLATHGNQQRNSNDGRTAEKTVAEVTEAGSYLASAVPHLIAKVVHGLYERRKRPRLLRRQRHAREDGQCDKCSQ
jgi:hypothetical protein